MSELFLKVVNMSISAGWLVLAVLACRLALKRAPKWVNVLLWGIVAVRLLLPFSIESAVSLIPSAETISPDIMMDPTPSVNTGIPALNSAVNPVISQSFTPSPAASANPLQIWIPVFAVVWLAGVAVLLVYTAVSYWRLRRKVDTAVRFRDNIFQSENVASPFVLGVIKPRIYLPFSLDGRDMENVVAHELAHTKRRDHWWKPLGFLLLTVHWFNPLMWLAYVLLCRDIELACDEKVIRELDNEHRADYTQALLACSVSRRGIAACPLAFGEVGVKERVKSVLNYRRPTLRMVAAAVIVYAMVAVCFLTNPAAASEFSMDGRNVSELDPQKIVSRIIKNKHLDKGATIYTNGDNFQLTLTSDFIWANSDAILYFYYKGQETYSSQLRIFPEDNSFFITESTKWPEQDRVYLLLYFLQALKYLPQEEISAMAPDADQYLLRLCEYGTPDTYSRVITYTENGAEPIGGWFIHLEIQPMWKTSGGGYHGTGNEIIHLFYEKEDPKPTLTLDDVIALSQKGYELSWADFERFDHFAGGNGLYQWVFAVEDPFQLMVGGSTDTAPKYIYLQTRPLDGASYIDIRDGGVEEFIEFHKDNPRREES